MSKRHVIINFDGPLPAFLPGTSYPTDLEVYTLKPQSNLDVQIDLALLNDMESPMDLVFVGGGGAGEKLAAEYKAHFVNTLDELDPAVWT